MADELVELKIPTEEEMKDACEMCLEKENVWSLIDIIKDKDQDKAVVGQARLLIDLGFNPKTKLCQECFWK